MNFEIIGEPLKLADYYQEDHDVLVRDILNDKYIGWVFIKNEDPSMNGIYHVTEYKLRTKVIDMAFDMEYLGSSVKIDELDNVEVQKHVTRVNLLGTDTIYKLEEKNEEKSVKIRWYKKGKLRTYEEFTNEVDPYGEERWDEGPQIFDYSDEDVDTQVENLRNILLEDQHGIFMSEPNADFYYTERTIEAWSEEGFDEDFGPGNAKDEIVDVWLNEDGEIIFTSLISKYIEITDDYDEHKCFYTVDKNYPIIIDSKNIEIRL